MTQTVTPNKLITVYMIEDFKLTRMGITAYFNQIENIKIIGEAENAETGLHAIRTFRPNVVLMDLGLPGMNGIEATQHVKNFNKNIKVIVLTSHERDEDVIAALGAGADAYCLKDIEPQKLAEVISTVAEGGNWLDPAIAAVAEKMVTDQVKQPGKEGHYAGDNKNQLTERELEVLRLVVEGKSNTEIAKTLFVSVHTAKAHVCNILQKLFVNDRVQAAVKAIKEGIV